MSTEGPKIGNKPDGLARNRVLEGELFVATRDFLLGVRYLAQGEVVLLDPREERVRVALEAQALTPYREGTE